MKRLLTILFVLVSAASFAQVEATKLQFYGKIDGLGTYNVSYMKSLLDTLVGSVPFIQNPGNFLQSGTSNSFGGNTDFLGNSHTLQIGTTLNPFGTINIFSGSGGLGIYSTSNAVFGVAPSNYYISFTTVQAELVTPGFSLLSNSSAAQITDNRATKRGFQYAADYSANYTTRSLTDKAYVDAKVADAINDGTTTIAPSQNAVFDALALRQPLDAGLTALAALDVIGNANKKVVLDGAGGFVAATQLENPATDPEDLIKFDGAAFVRIPIGSNGNILTITGGVVGWAAPAAGVTPAALTKTDDTNVTLTLGGTPATSLLQATSLTLGWTGELSAIRGGTGFGSYAVGDLISAGTTTTFSKIPAVAAGSMLRSAGTNTLPAYSTTTWPNTATANLILYATGTNAFGTNAALAFTGTTLNVTGGIVGTTGIVNSTSGGSNNGLSAIRNSQLTANNVKQIYSTGSYSLRATGADINYVFHIDNTITTAANSQDLRLMYINPAVTINHTSVPLYGIYYNPTLPGSQLPASHYGLVIGKGDAIIGGTVPVAKLHITGNGNSTGVGLLFESLDGTDRLSLLDNGTATLTGTINVSGTAQSVTGVISGGNTTSAGYFEAREDLDNGGEYVRHAAASSLAANATYTWSDLPTADGAIPAFSTTGTQSWLYNPIVAAENFDNTANTYAIVLLSGLVPNNSVYEIEVSGSGVESAGAGAYGFVITSTIRRDNSGNFAIVGTNTTSLQSTGVTVPTVTIVSNAIQLDVATGLTGAKNNYKVVIKSKRDY